jgi:hypothetical protein
MESSFCSSKGATVRSAALGALAAGIDEAAQGAHERTKSPHVDPVDALPAVALAGENARVGENLEMMGHGRT